MAYKLNGVGLPFDVPFTHNETNYPANWLRLSTEEDRKAIGITEVDDPILYDSTFFYQDGTSKSLTDTNATDANGDLLKDSNGNQVVILGVKSVLKRDEKGMASQKLSKYDWYVTRKAEKGTAIPTEITTYRDAIRTACNTRETEIDNCADTAALVTLYGVTTDSDGKFVKYNMTQYPKKI